MIDYNIPPVAPVLGKRARLRNGHITGVLKKCKYRGNAMTDFDAKTAHVWREQFEQLQAWCNDTGLCFVPNMGSKDGYRTVMDIIEILEP